MPRRSAARKTTRTRKRHPQPSNSWTSYRPRFWSKFVKLLPAATARRRWLRMFLLAPGIVQFILVTAAVLLVWVTANFIYQVARKPTELFFPISGVLHRTPTETWRAYGGVFRRHSTDVISAEFLAALAQVEGSGNPIVRTYWRWSLDPDPFEMYRPASSAVGMYQITNGTFVEARRYCIHDHVVVADGPWNDWKSCWFNSLYTRVIASHSVELTSAYLDNRVAGILRRHRIARATRQQKQDLAAVIHLCGAGAGDTYARRGLKFRSNQKCGDHSAQGYVARVNAMKAVFMRLSKDDD
jgi:hypothetical protein